MERYILDKVREKVLDRGLIRNMPEKTLQEAFILEFRMTIIVSVRCWALALQRFLNIVQNHVCAHSRILGYGSPRLLRTSEASLLSDEIYISLFSTVTGTTSR